MDKLKPCPFCGGEAILEEIPGNPDSKDAYCWAAGCKECDIGWYGDTKEDAIEKWNRRLDPENKPLALDQIRQMGGEIDELEEAYDNLKFQSDTKDQQIATLKKALEIASTEVNAAFETLESHHVINMTQKGGIQENIDTWIQKANQAQEQGGEK